MNRYKSSAELKNLAKNKLNGNFGAAIGAIVLVEAINYVASSLVAILAPGLDIVSMIMSILLSGVISIFIGVFSTGLALFFLNIACGQPHSISDIFYGYKEQPEKSLLVSLAHVGISIVCLTPYQIFMTLFMESQSTVHMSLTLISMAVGLLVYVPVSMLISQSYYLILDFPQYSAKEVLSTSCKIMKSHLGRYFYIQVSFLPLMFLCVFTCGIGFLWLIPYMQMTSTCFFLDVMNPEKTAPEEAY